MASTLPRRIKLPFSAPIRVIELPSTDPSIEDCDGLWDVDERTIYIRKSLSLARKKVVLFHELLHAVHDLAWELEQS